MGLRKLLLFLFLLIGFASEAQVLQAPNVYGYQFKRVGGDTLVFIPGDTLQVPVAYNAKTFIARKGTALYYWNGSKWMGIGGGSSTPYVDSIWRVAGKDSIFWLKDGTTYKFLDSTGVSSNIYTANGTATGNRTYNANGNRLKFDNLQWLDIEFSPNLNSYFQFAPEFTMFYVYDNVNNSGAAYQDIVANPGEVFHQIGARNKADLFVGSNASHDAGYIKLENVKNTGSETQRLRLDSSGIRFEPFRGNIYIDTVAAGASTDSVMVWNALTGKVGRRNASDFTGSGGITSLGGQTGATQTFTAGMGVSITSSSNNHTFALRNDTTTLAVFGGGSGAAGDTAAFTTDALYGSFYTDVDTFIVTKVVAVIQAGATDTLGVQIYFNDSLNTATTGVLTSTLALTSRPQGHSSTSFSNATIPPGSWIWAKSPTIVSGRKPEYLSVSLIGYRKRRS